jgi:hypothetical protein
MGHFLRWTKDGAGVVFGCPGGGRPSVLKVALDGGEPEPLPEVAGGAHLSFSPDFSRILDVVGHKAMWVSPLRSGTPEKVFEFEDPDVRIDYPAFRPQGGDLWLTEGLQPA